MDQVDETLDLSRGGALSREMLATMFDQSVDCVKVLDRDGRIAFMNRNGLCSMEIDDFASLRGQPWDGLWPADAQQQVRDAVAAAQAGRPSRFEAFCPTAKGTPRWWDISVSPVHDAGGGVAAILSTSRDVTPTRTSAERMETMAHEMRHRLRNAFAISGAIVRASGREEAEHEPFAIDLAQRLQTLSIAQVSLIDPHGGEPLAALVGRIAEAYGAGRIACDGLPRVALDEQRARLVALVLGELATNSLKHGALGAGGAVAVRGTTTERSLALEWRESLPSPRAPAPSAEGGSGYGLMRRMARAHGGAFALELGEDELTARLELPLGEAGGG